MRRYGTEKFRASRPILAAADPLPDDLCNALAKIGRATVHYFPIQVILGQRPASRLWIDYSQRMRSSSCCRRAASCTAWRR